MSLTRRSVLKSGVSLAGLVALEQLSSAEWAGTAFASDPSMIGVTWDYALRNSTGPAPSAQVAWRQQVSTQGTYNGNAFVSAALLPVGRVLPTQFSSTDTRWALWAWKHDGEPRMLMWTGPEAFGNQAGGFGDDLPKPNLTEIHIELVGSAPAGHASIYAPGQCGTDVGYTPGTAGIPLLQPPVPATMATAYSCLAIPSVPAFVNVNADGSPVSPPWQYLNDSVASGDIVWQSIAPSTAYPDGSRLVASPHIARGRFAADGTLIDSAQDVFLLESVDGTHWTWLDGDNRPRVICGWTYRPADPAANPDGYVRTTGTNGAPAPDSTHSGYGRLLTDLDGRLVQAISNAPGAPFTPQYWHVYRALSTYGGQNHESVWMAYSSDLVHWTKMSSASFTAPPPVNGDTGTLGFTCFKLATSPQGWAASPNVYWAYSAAANTFLAYSMYLYSASDWSTWEQPSPPPSIPAPPGTSTLDYGGGNLVRDPWSSTGTQYLLLTSQELGAKTNFSDFWILRQTA